MIKPRCEAAPLRAIEALSLIKPRCEIEPLRQVAVLREMLSLIKPLREIEALRQVAVLSVIEPLRVRVTGVLRQVVMRCAIMARREIEVLCVRVIEALRQVAVLSFIEPLRQVVARCEIKPLRSARSRRSA